MPFDFFNIVNQTNDTADVEIYGQIVSETPTDWYGDPVEGNYFSSQEFDKLFNSIKDKKTINVRINSPGGNLFAGVGVYNKLKHCNATINVFIEGIAASSAGLIACAGDTVTVGTGAIWMAHEASSVIFFASMTEEDFQKEKDAIAACNKAVAEIIAEKTGKTVDEIREQLKDEIWLSGQELIDFGIADELDSNNSSKPVINAQTKQILAGGKAFGIENISNSMINHLDIVETVIEPEPQNTSNSVESAGENKNLEKKEDEVMTLDELKNEHPDLYNQIRDEAISEERNRQKAFDQIADKIADKDTLNQARYESNDSAKDLLFKAATEDKTTGTAFMASVKEDLEQAGTANVGAENSQKTDAQKKADIIANAAATFNATKK